jgi:hypothetical protein
MVVVVLVLELLSLTKLIQVSLLDMLVKSGRCDSFIHLFDGLHILLVWLLVLILLVDYHLQGTSLIVDAECIDILIIIL